MSARGHIRGCIDMTYFKLFVVGILMKKCLVKIILHQLRFPFGVLVNSLSHVFEKSNSKKKKNLEIGCTDCQIFRLHECVILVILRKCYLVRKFADRHMLTHER